MNRTCEDIVVCILNLTHVHGIYLFLFCSSLAQTLEVSTFVGEIIFTICIILIGLILLAFLIGNMQVRH